MTKLDISGMTCNHCVAAVRKALAGVDGVEEVVEVTLETGSATVRGSASADALMDAVREAGYQARVR
ncbi:MAG: cation transporter [Gammaproteobacteria bacterium]